MTRKWKNRHTIIQSIKLFMIDEIHLLGESSRGATIEAVVSRMKSSAYSTDSLSSNESLSQRAKIASSTDGSKVLRLIAVSATIPNVEDFAYWLSSDLFHRSKAVSYRINESFRPVKIRKVVLGYYFASDMTDFRFDLSLSYKLATIIDEYAEGKPTLIFCSTRKGTMQAADILARENSYFKNGRHRQHLIDASKELKDDKLRELISLSGIAYHNAGIDVQDRHIVEQLFLGGFILVLCKYQCVPI
jgi:ATP-dependent DNA helicase HFM1/MER3